MKWKKKFQVWQNLTEAPLTKQGGLLVLRLDEQTQDTILEKMTTDDLKAEGAANQILTYLDEMFKKDKSVSAFEIYEDFESYKRPPHVSMAEFCSEFERKLSKVKSDGTQIAEHVLAYRMLKSANLSNREEQLVKATASNMTHADMVKQLKKVFNNVSFSDNSETEFKIKEEPDEGPNETLYGSKYKRNRNYYPRDRREESRNRNVNWNEKRKENKVYKKKRGKNPLDIYGNVTRCRNCESINHWEEYCPDKRNTNRNNYVGEAESEEDTDNQCGSDDELAYELETLSVNVSLKCDDPTNSIPIHETFNIAVLDCGAVKNVCGNKWLEQYIDTLSPSDKKRVEYSPTKNVYKFGCGSKCSASTNVTIPAVIGNTPVTIQSDVVEGELPLLLSRSCMKKAKCDLNFKNDTINILGQTLNLGVTRSGHYGLALGRNRQKLIDTEESEEVKLTLYVKDMSNEKIAVKLHRQFAHPTAERLIRLVRSQGKECEELVKCIKDVTKNCQVCIQYKKPPPRPVVGFPLATRFGECVAMDLKQFGKVHLLHIIDSATRLSAVAIIKSKQAEVIIREIFRQWVSVYGVPESILSDNGGEFNNAHFRELGEKCNLVIKTTAAESAWSNGMVERHNRILGDSIMKTQADTGCSLEMAAMWCVTAHNSLANIHGFSPFQLVFGRNPVLPALQTDKPPALDNETTCDMLRKNLEAMHAARQAHIRSESSEKVRRALSHNIRTYSDVQFFTGDKVYYRRRSSKKWSGPATVIGKNGQQVLVKHGGEYYRVHPCRLTLEKHTVVGCEKQGTGESQKNKDTNNNQSSKYVDDSSSDEEFRIPSESEQDDITETTPHEQATESIQSNENVESRHKTGPNIGESSRSITENDESKDEHPSNNIDPKSHISDQSSDTSSEDESISSESETEDEVVNTTETELEKRKPGRPKKKINGSTKELPTAIKPNCIVTYKLKDQSNWNKVQIVSRAGKKKGKYGNTWNALNTIDENVVIDFNNDVSEWNIVDEEFQNNTMFVSLVEEEEETEVYLTDSYICKNKQEVALAKQKELQSWNDNKVYTEVRDENQKCVASKWVVKPKIIDNKLSVKARLVLKGFQEMKDFRTDSPTCMIESVRLVLAIMATQSWPMNSIDFKTAFLQGNNIERAIYVRPPKEAASNKVWKLNKTVYGLCDAPRQWYLRLKGLIVELGCKISSIDNSLFTMHLNDELVGLIASYVDDILWAGNMYFQDKVIVRLKSELHVGSEQVEAFSYIGIKLKQDKDFSITLSQNSYIDNLKLQELSPSRMKQKNDTLTKLERRQLRGVVGKINWVRRISRPDIGFSAGMITAGSKATVSDVLAANKLVKYVKDTPSYIKFPKLKSIRDIYLQVYTDASYGNLKDSGSQGGHIIFLTDGKRSCPISWSSRKVRRLVKSTLAAETLALVDGCESAYMIGKLIAETIYGNQDLNLPIVCVTDNHSLYEAAHSTHVLEDKRLTIEMGIVRQMVSRGEIQLKWCNSNEQVSDVLTKKGASGELVRWVLQKGVLSQNLKM